MKASRVPESISQNGLLEFVGSDGCRRRQGYSEKLPWAPKYTCCMPKGTLPDRSDLAALARKVMRATGATEVFLFGSHARGEAGPDSDVDVLYIVPDDANLRETAGRAERALWPREWPLDLVPMPELVWRAGTSALARRVEVEGVLLARVE
jgi:hypothetical protein